MIAHDHSVLWLLKDADGLDRVRLCDLDASYLRHQATRAWIPMARRLDEETMPTPDVAAIWQVARDLGLPVAELLRYVDAVELNAVGPKPPSPCAS